MVISLNISVPLTYIYMEVNNGKEFDNMQEIEKQNNPKMINILRRKVDILKS